MGRVRLLEPPHTGSNYIMKEMFFAVARERSRALRIIAVVLGGILPALLTLVSLTFDSGVSLTLAAVVSHLVGVVASRWLFFAEAEHVVARYYGGSRTGTAAPF